MSISNDLYHTNQETTRPVPNPSTQTRDIHAVELGGFGFPHYARDEDFFLDHPGRNHLILI